MHYDCNDYIDEKRESIQRWNDHLIQIVEGHTDTNIDNVVRIPG